jgi:hypothetical protein
MKLCSLLISKTELKFSVSHFLHTYICERFIYFQDLSVYFAAAKYVHAPILGINRSQTHECGNRGWGRASPKKGIHKWDFHCSVLYGWLQSIREWKPREGISQNTNFLLLCSVLWSRCLIVLNPIDSVQSCSEQCHPWRNMEQPYVCSQGVRARTDFSLAWLEAAWYSSGSGHVPTWN